MKPRSHVEVAHAFQLTNKVILLFIFPIVKSEGIPHSHLEVARVQPGQRQSVPVAGLQSCFD